MQDNTLSLEELRERFKNEFVVLDSEMELVTLELKDALASGSYNRRHQAVELIFLKYSTMGVVCIKSIGAGAFADVYKAKVVETGEIVAVKMFRLGNSKETIDAVHNEIKALMEGNGCPQLVQYHSTGVFGTELWIIMEFVSGGSLFDIIRKDDTLCEDHCAIVAREVLIALDYLDGMGTIHRDLKAANILIQNDGTVKLADLGASKSLSETTDHASTFIGSPYWIAPEVIKGEPYNGKADLWSLGITMIELCLGKPPFSNLVPVKAVTKIVTSPSPVLGEEYSEDFNDFVNLCLQKDPACRPTVAQLLSHVFITEAEDVSQLAILLQ